MPITYTDDATQLSPDQLTGFFVGWPEHPDPRTHMEILRRSYAVWLAFDQERCVGFINALSDGIFYAYIPLLEVLPEYQGQGIGTELLQRMVASLADMYGIDIVCDKSAASFYTTRGFSQCAGMARRNYAKQGAANRRI